MIFSKPKTVLSLEALLRLSIIGSFLGFAGAARSQAPSSNGQKVVYAQYTNTKITIDGELTEPAWETAEPAKGFTQTEPTEGAPASEWTEVRILYDDKNLYIGAYCHDRNPQRIVINDIGRDYDAGQQDYIAVVLDTFNDDRSGFYFATTPAGGQRDQQFMNEGRDTNIGWDGIWYSESRIHEDSWTAEIAIPFNTLRFNRAKSQVWGVQLLRRIRRDDEAAYWAPIPRRHNALRGIGMAGDLRGIENAEPGRNLTVKPYVLGGIQQLPSRGKGTAGDFDAGLDLKLGVTPSLALDLTLNTDFSHVEADAQQVNLTRFPLFFPEKREFFLENAGIFLFGATQGNEALLFHSRKIGLAGGEPIPILGGARLTGRAGSNYLGLLNIQTRSEGAVPATNFTAARLRRDFLSSSNVGMIFLNRQSGQPADYNRAFGLDSNFLFFQTKLRISSTLAKTLTPSRRGDDRLSKLEGEWQSNLVRFTSSFVDVQKNFNPEMGFVRRPGRKIILNEFDFKPRLRRETRLGSFVRNISTLLTSEHALLSNGSTETKLLRPRLQIGFQDASIFQARYTQNHERLIRPFEISSGVVIPDGDYRFNDFLLSYNSDVSKALSGNVSYSWGDFYNGEKTTLNLGARFRPSFKLSASIEYNKNNVHLPAGGFTTHLLQNRFDYTFNSKMFLNAFVQYNSDTKLVSANIRFRFIHRPLSDFYVVYNEQRDTVRKNNDRSLTVKYTHLLNF
ncbi:MAG: carbohydrate binding family 9 domain-containing protein [Acidobacteria bacterium]|nr:carbohydrate binding family 9 domain-containing protein [Acidobacteriota bacterium]